VLSPQRHSSLAERLRSRVAARRRLAHLGNSSLEINLPGRAVARALRPLKGRPLA